MTVESIDGWSIEYRDDPGFGVLAEYELLLSDGLKYDIPIEDLNRTLHFKCTGRNIFGPVTPTAGFPDFVMVEPWYA